VAAKKSQSLRKAINAHCRSCVYDSQAAGSWRAQVTLCPCTGCELYGVRPTTDAIADSVYEYYGEEPPDKRRESLKTDQIGSFSEETAELCSAERGVQ
jgi:hypothetical protein